MRIKNDDDGELWGKKTKRRRKRAKFRRYITGSNEEAKWTTTTTTAKNRKVGMFRSARTHDLIVVATLVRRWSEKSSAQRSTEIISYLRFVKRVDLYMGFRVFSVSVFFFQQFLCWSPPSLPTTATQFSLFRNEMDERVGVGLKKTLNFSFFRIQIRFVYFSVHSFLLFDFRCFFVEAFKCVYC